MRTTGLAGVCLLSAMITFESQAAGLLCGNGAAKKSAGTSKNSSASTASADNCNCPSHTGNGMAGQAFQFSSGVNTGNNGIIFNDTWQEGTIPLYGNAPGMFQYGSGIYYGPYQNGSILFYDNGMNADLNWNSLNDNGMNGTGSLNFNSNLNSQYPAGTQTNINSNASANQITNQGTTNTRSKTNYNNGKNVMGPGNAEGVSHYGGAGAYQYAPDAGTTGSVNIQSTVNGNNTANNATASGSANGTGMQYNSGVSAGIDMNGSGLNYNGDQYPAGTQTNVSSNTSANQVTNQGRVNTRKTPNYNNGKNVMGPGNAEGVSQYGGVGAYQYAPDAGTTGAATAPGNTSGNTANGAVAGQDGSAGQDMQFNGSINSNGSGLNGSLQYDNSRNGSLQYNGSVNGQPYGTSQNAYGNTNSMDTGLQFNGATGVNAHNDSDRIIHIPGMDPYISTYGRSTAKKTTGSSSNVSCPPTGK